MTTAHPLTMLLLNNEPIMQHGTITLHPWDADQPPPQPRLIDCSVSGTDWEALGTLTRHLACAQDRPTLTDWCALVAPAMVYRLRGMLHAYHVTHASAEGWTVRLSMHPG